MNTTTTTDLATTAKSALDRLNRSLETSDLDAIVRGRSRRSLLLVDCSGSMNETVKSGKRKIDALRSVVEELRSTHPVPVASFGGLNHNPMLVDSVPEPSGCTPLHLAIDFGRVEGANHLVIVTDGQPDSADAAFNSAREFKGPCDVFYIGDGNDEGSRFASRLAKLTGGTVNLTDLGQPKALAAKIAGFLGDGTVATAAAAARQMGSGTV
jgi:hypothetical protein